MTDLHTHILARMDDGASDIETSLSMLRLQREQGVDTVVLTPHFYRNRERPKSFICRRMEAMQALEQAISELPNQERQSMPRLVLGAEVAWVPHMAEWDELPEFCVGKSKNLLIELPFTSWNDHMLHQLYDLPGRTGFLPIIAHLERYYEVQRPEIIDEVIMMGFPVQLSAEPFLHPLRRGRVMKMLKNGHGHVLASDCHSLNSRKPNLGLAMDVVEKKLGRDMKNHIICQTEDLVRAKNE